VFVGIEDIIQRKGEPYFGRFFFGLTKPKKSIFGTEFCGEIEEIGADVLLFKKGDIVFGVTGASFGCYAEYICMPESGLLAIKPQNMTQEEVTPVCGALNAWNLLKTIANIQSGQKVLIYGASGNIGLAAIQVSKMFGAQVTGVCSSNNFELVKSQGADYIHDYSDYELEEGEQKYDVILNVAGKKTSIHFKNSLNKNGYYLTTYPTITTLFQSIWTSMFNGKKVVFSATGLKSISERKKLLSEIEKLFNNGKLTTIIDRVYNLEQMVDAHNYIEKGHERGNVVVKVKI
jgi:NADPH:quinone reductase-like Zn-dependent oxidoreductase